MGCRKPNSSITLALTHVWGRVLFVSALAAGAQDSAAIGDSSGCGVDLRYVRTLSHGSVADVNALVALKVAEQAQFLEQERKKRNRTTPRPHEVSREEYRAKLIGGQMYCGINFPIDYAAGHGNVEVVKWLLDQGADPSATSAGPKGNVFTRCKGLDYGPPPGMSKQQALERQLEAYRLLVARGADINAMDAFYSGGCLSEEMLPLLHQLGARVTREAFASRIAATRNGHVIYERRWATVVQMARWQSFDFRGTAVEESLAWMLDARAGMSDYDAVVELTRRVGTVVRLSPGIVPGQPARPEDVPTQFVPTRETCFFPEISAYPDFEFVALWRDAGPAQTQSNAISATADTTRVNVGHTKAPVLLALVNNRDTPTTWQISLASEARVLGVIVLDIYSNQRGSKDRLSFDPLRPAYFEDGTKCNVHVLAQSDQRPRNELRPYWPPNPSSRSYNPFRLRGEPPITTSQHSEFVVGDLSPSAALTAWPESVRVKTKSTRQ